MDHLDVHPRLRTEDAHRALDAQGRRLVNRLREEVPARFRVTYRPC